MRIAKEHKERDIDFWKRVIFTDESIYNIFGYDGKDKIWRKSGTVLEFKCS